jgi:hypothetical protein
MTWRVDFEMYVRRAMRLEPEEVENTSGAWMPGNIVGRRDNSDEGEFAVRVAADAPAKIPLG